MQTASFCVKIRENYEEVLNDFFPYLSKVYVEVSRNFKLDKDYPVLAVKDVVIVSDDESTIETSKFLVPTENGNFMWVQSEIFVFSGLIEDDK